MREREREKEREREVETKATCEWQLRFGLVWLAKEERQTSLLCWCCVGKRPLARSLSRLSNPLSLTV